MTLLVGILNLGLGVIYSSYGVMTLIDMKRGWKTMGFSHFGAAWIAMAFTCGPHHLNHGMHVLFGGAGAGSLDAAAVLVGLPAGLAWFLLRLEAFAGGRGDRLVGGNPRWLMSLPSLSGVYVTALIAVSFGVLSTNGTQYNSLIAPSALLLMLYGTIGYFLVRTQLRNHQHEGGWSVSGITLGVVFPTCGLMHAMHAMYATAGLYRIDNVQIVIDWLSVPAAIYFLWVVRGLYLDALEDWNRSTQKQAVLAG